jgi:hypothetical protein
MSKHLQEESSREKEFGTRLIFERPSHKKLKVPREN